MRSARISVPSRRRRRASTAPETGSKPVSTCSVTRAASEAGRASGSSGAASRMRAAAFISSDATANSFALASGSVRGSRAPPPPARRKLPGSPRRCAMRSGKAAASSLPGSPSASASAGKRSRRRYWVATRRMRASAPRSAAGSPSTMAWRRRPISAGASAPRSGSRSSSRAARSAAQAASPGVSAASIIAASRGCAPSRRHAAAGAGDPAVLVQRAEFGQQRRRRRQRAGAAADPGKRRSAGAAPQAAQSSASAGQFRLQDFRPVEGGAGRDASASTTAGSPPPAPRARPAPPAARRRHG